MEDQQMQGYHSCHTCLRAKYRRMKVRWIQILAVFTVSVVCVLDKASAETLCGGELVDALQFVCEDRGFYFSRPTSRSNSRRTPRGIVEECCFQSCDLHLLEQYCAKPAKSERDVSATSFQAVPVIPPLNKEILRKHVTVKYSRYEMWQRKAAQRLRRGIPAILRISKFRRQAEKLKAQEPTVFHRRLITVPSRVLPPLPPTQNYVSYK